MFQYRIWSNSKMLRYPESEEVEITRDEVVDEVGRGGRDVPGRPDQLEITGAGYLTNCS